MPREYDDPAEARWSGARRVPHPVRCFTEPVRLSRPLEDYAFTRTYVNATGDDPGAPGNALFWRLAEHARSSVEWRYREVDTGT